MEYYQPMSTPLRSVWPKKESVAHRSHPTEALCSFLGHAPAPTFMILARSPKHWQQQMFTLDSKYQSHDVMTKFRILAIYFHHLTQQKAIRKLNFQFDIWH